jgi:AcrR family transcriptional regulator
MVTASRTNDADRGASSRDRLLAAAKQLFAARGYENTSTVAIARQAGTSESQLMKHFGSKEGLLEAIFDAGWARLAEALSSLRQLPSPAQKLQTLLDGTLAGMERDPELKKLMLLEGRRIRREGRMVLTTAGYLGFVGALDEILAEMRAARQLREDVNPQAVRSALIGIFEGILRDQMLAGIDGFPSTATAGDLRQLFGILLPALAPHGHRGGG